MPIGIRMMNVTSKNTGMDRMKPAMLRPQTARFSGNAATSLSAITEAAPLSFISWPSMVPKPTGRPMLVIISPKPDEIVVAVVSRSRPPATPINRQAMTMPMAALSLSTIIQNRMIAIATTKATISIAGLAISFSPFLITRILFLLLYQNTWDSPAARPQRTDHPGNFQNRLPSSSKGRSYGSERISMFGFACACGSSPSEISIYSMCMVSGMRIILMLF